MTICNKNCDISRGDLLGPAKRYNIKGAGALIEKAAGVVSRYEHYARQAAIVTLSGAEKLVGQMSFLPSLF